MCDKHFILFGGLLVLHSRCTFILILNDYLFPVKQFVNLFCAHLSLVCILTFCVGHSIPGRSIAYSDAGAALTDEDYLSGIKKAPGNIFEHDSLQYPTKEYNIELKPLFSAFGWKSLAQTSLRSFLMCYLLLLEPRSNVEEDDDDFLQDAPEEHHVDLVAPFKKSVVQIIREVTLTNFCHLFICTSSL